MIEFVYHSRNRHMRMLFIYYTCECVRNNPEECKQDAILRAKEFFNCENVRVSLFTPKTEWDYGAVTATKV